jgi:hypothetical protein
MAEACMRLIVVVALGALAATSALAQQQQIQRQTNLNNSNSREKAAPPKITPEQKKLGTQLLQRAEMEAAGLQGGMRAYALMQVSRGYAQTDKPKAVELLENAFAATRVVDDDKLDTRSKLQQEILSQMVALAPDKVDDYLPSLSPEARKPVLESLLSYYEQNKQLDHAIELVYRIAHESEFPYRAGARVIQALPPDDNAEVNQLYTTALGSYREHKHTGIAFRGDDFAEILVRHWKRLPPAQVKEGVYEVLKQAEASGKDDNSQPNRVSMASDKGSLQFNSAYEYRLFQLLPVLRHVDEDEADKLIKEHKDAEALLAKYPDGAASFMPSVDAEPGGGERHGPASKGHTTTDQRPRSGTSMVTVGGSVDPKGDMAAQVSEMQRSAKIASDAEEHPQDALANAGAIQNKSFRTQALMGIARINAKKNPSVAKSALSQAVDLAPDLPEPAIQMFMMRDAAETYLRMDETDSAKKVIEKGLGLADKAYKADANADDPNKALKAYWPSTEGYRSMLRVASKISPQWAATLLKDIADPDVKVSAEAAMALQYIGAPAGPSRVVTARKDNVNMMVSDNTD